MEQLPDLPRIKSEHPPSYFNYEMANSSILGWLVGWVGSVVFMKWPRTGLLLPAIGTFIGGIVGGIQGKARQEREAIDGKVVEKPHFWNRGGTIGMAIGFAAEAVAQVVSVSHGGIGTGWGGLVAILGCSLAGCVIGQQTMQRDYNRALILQRDKDLARSRDLEMVQGLYKNTVTPDELLQIMQRQQSKERPPVKSDEPPVPGIRL